MKHLQLFEAFLNKSQKNSRYQRKLDSAIREYVYRESLLKLAETTYELAKLGKEISHYSGVSKVQDIRKDPDATLSFAKRGYEKCKDIVDDRKKQVIKALRHESFENAIEEYMQKNPVDLSPEEQKEEKILQKEIAQVLHDHRGKIKGEKFNF